MSATKHAVEYDEKRDASYRIWCICGKSSTGPNLIAAHREHELHMIDAQNQMDAGL